MSQPKQTVSIRLLDSEFQISCSAEEKDELLESARYLDNKMREIKGNSIVGIDRVAVMAALTISHELVKEKRKVSTSADDLKRLSDKINKALGNQSQLQL